MMKVFYFLLGFLLMVIGFFYTIVYINLISFGYNIKEYFIKSKHLFCNISLDKENKWE